MSETENNWLETILLENKNFRNRISTENLPVERTPGSLAVMTCMDPRVNLQAIGIPGFSEQGEGSSAIRIIRTIGGMADERSLLIGIFLAGIREIAVLMHTDCGCCLANSKMDLITSNLEHRLSETQLQRFKENIGEPFQEKLAAWLKVFDDSHTAIKKEIAAIKSLPFMPDDIIIHGLLYTLASGSIEVVLNGYDENDPRE
ncbi:MAG: hypothetical protein JEZ00_12460 [Anaerolineaceae bacterium]|nr:hypothetical protein [Anaerolineaceae bacterium]